METTNTTTMLITIALLFFAYSMMGKPISERLTRKAKEIDWSGMMSKTWKAIKRFGLKAGRATCKPLLYFYYVMFDEKTSAADKALIYGAIIYIIAPFGLIPRRIMGLLGIVDDVAVSAFVLNKIGKLITPEIEEAVNKTLNEWFGSSAPATC